MRIPGLPIIFLFITSFLIDLYISFDCRQVWKKRGFICYWISSLVCYAILIVALCLPRRDAGSGLAPIMWLLFTYISIYIGKVVYFFLSFLGKIVRKALRFKDAVYPFRIAGLAFGLIIIGIMWIGAGYTRHHIVVVEENFFSPKIPPSFDGYKIAQISDLHVGTWGFDTKFVNKLVDNLHDLNPDLIVFTGDIVNQKTDELIPFIETLSRMNAPDGIYSILGNHDYGDYIDWPDPEAREKNNRLLAAIEQGLGWKLLNNQMDFIKRGNDSIMILGIENWGEPPFPKYGDLEKTLPSSRDSLYHQNDSNFKILLSHNPEHWNQEVSQKTNIDLTLSGHTHAMQIMIKIGDWKWSPAKYRYEQWSGRYKRNNKDGQSTELYVNMGAGEVGMPARLLSAYPEITLFTLRSGDPR